MSIKEGSNLHSKHNPFKDTHLALLHSQQQPLPAVYLPQQHHDLRAIRYVCKCILELDFGVERARRAQVPDLRVHNTKRYRLSVIILR